MFVRDACGRRISLLNYDDDGDKNNSSKNKDSKSNNSKNNTTATTKPHAHTGPSYYAQAAGSGSTPNTPELLRSNSYDSYMSAEPISPVTPLYEPVARYAPTLTQPPATYDEYYAEPSFYAGAKRRPSEVSDGRSVTYEDDSTLRASGPSERPAKRFPCRYRETLGCQKTFTTSGHASRHAKIHTAEKSVQCTHGGCTKRFTRSDNMKQHLETHNKDKSRPASSRPSLSSSERRSSTSGRSSRSKAAVAALTVEVTAVPSAALPSPGKGGIWDMRAIDVPLLPRPTAVQPPPSGLDALVMAAACQERR